MFKNIKIKSFRAFENIEVDNLRNINLFVGKNNSGKTTLLESIFILINPVNTELLLRINFYRGLNIIGPIIWQAYFNQFHINSNIIIGGEIRKPDEKRTLTIKPYISAVANQDLRDTTLQKNLIESNHIITETMQNIDGLNLEYEVKKPFEDAEFYETLLFKDGDDLKTKPVKNYKPNLRGIFLNTETIMKDISGRFADMQVKKQIEKVIYIFQKVEPNLKSLTLGTGNYVYADIGLSNMLPLNFLGDGFIRLLSIILAIADAENGIVLIDEIDNGFHYSSQEILWDAIYWASDLYKVQVFATTHSLECVKAFANAASKHDIGEEKSKLIRIERDREMHRAIQYEVNEVYSSLESGWEIR